MQVSLRFFFHTNTLSMAATKRRFSNNNNNDIDDDNKKLREWRQKLKKFQSEK